jgi:hypothetical protein
MFSRAHLALAEFELTPLVMIGTDCINSCKSNYHTIILHVYNKKMREFDDLKASPCECSTLNNNQSIYLQKHPLYYLCKYKMRYENNLFVLSSK